MVDFTILQTLDDLRTLYPTEVEQLDKCTSVNAYESFISNATSSPSSYALNEVARYARIRSIQARVPSPAVDASDQHDEDSVAERLWHTTVSIDKKIDKNTKRLIARHGFLGAMIEQLNPIGKIGVGNFLTLQKCELANCTAEYCVWLWGQNKIDPKRLKRLKVVAQQYNFQ